MYRRDGGAGACARGSALAGEVTISPPYFFFYGGAEANHVTVTEDGGGYLFTDDSPIELNEDVVGYCQLRSAEAAWCPEDLGPGRDLIGVSSGGGADTIDLTALAQLNATVSPGPGEDTVYGGAQADSVFAKDGSVDNVDCGGGNDQAEADTTDVLVNCESVVRDEPAIQTAYASAYEGEALQFSVVLNRPAPTDFDVDYAVEHVSTADADFSPAGAPSGTVHFQQGDTQQTISVATADDALAEGDETFKLKLSNISPSTAAHFSSSEAVGTIYDDETHSALAVSGGSTTEGGKVAFTVIRSGPSDQAVSAHYATADITAHQPGDYAEAAGTVEFAPGVVSQTIEVQTVDDAIDEFAEAFSLVLSAPVNAKITGGTATGSISDNDEPPALTISDGTAAEGGKVAFTITKTGASEKTVSAQYATADGTAHAPGDYSAASGTVALTGAESSATIEVETAEDGVDESDEAFAVGLSGPENATISGATGTGTIADDDASPELTISGGSATEGGAVTFTVVKAGATERTVSVDYATADGTAQAPGDYAPGAGTLTFAPGETSKTFTVATTQDASPEPEEAFTASLSNPVNASAGPAATGRIADDDPPSASPAPPSQPGPAPRLKPWIGLSASPARDREAPFRYRLRGRLHLPAGAACPTSGSVTVEVRSRSTGRVLVGRRVALGDDCGFRLRLSFRAGAAAGGLRATAAFAGDQALMPARSKPRALRAG